MPAEPMPPEPIQAEPAPAELPSLTPCPEGWSTVNAETGPAHCEPWPADGVPECAGNNAQFPGDSNCTVVGNPCPAGSYSDALPEQGTVLFVQPDATGGDGSREQPFGTLTAAIDAASSGATLALAAGTFGSDGYVSLPAGVTVQGKCAKETRIEGGLFSNSGTVQVRDVHLGPASVDGVTVVGEGTRFELEGVVIEDVPGTGVILADGATVVARELVVRNVASEQGDDGYGRGIGTQNANLELERVRVEQVHNVGIYVRGSSATVQDVAVADVRPEPTLPHGHGMDVIQGSDVTVHRAVFEDNVGVGVALSSESQLSMERVLVRETAPDPDGDRAGAAIRSRRGTELSLVKSALVNNTERGALLGGEGAVTSSTLQDVVIRNTEPWTDGTAGYGLQVFGSTIDATRVAVVDSHVVGAAFNTAGATGTLRDLSIQDTRPRSSDGLYGNGVLMDRGADIVLERAHVEGSHQLGVRVNGEQSNLDASDLTVRNTNPSAANDRSGWAVAFTRGGGRLQRARIESAHGIGLFARGSESDVSLTDVRVRRIRAQASDGRFGRALDIEGGARVAGTRIRGSNTAGIGVFVMGEGTSAELTSIELDQMSSDPVEPSSTNTAALLVQLGASANVRRATLRGGRTRGVGALSQGTELTLKDTRVRGIRADAEGVGGRGLEVTRGAVASVERLHLSNNQDLGMLVADTGTELHVQDVLVRDTVSEARQRRRGYGVGVIQGAALRGSVLRVEDNRGVGLYLSGNATGELESVGVLQTRPEGCAERGCAMPGGFGIGAYGGAGLRLEDFLVQDATLCGVHLAEGGAADLSGGTVRQARIGACVQTEPFEFDRLSEGVRYVDNERNLDTTSLPVPRASVPGVAPSEGSDAPVAAKPDDR